jgi:hypothetical protein
MSKTQPRAPRPFGLVQSTRSTLQDRLPVLVVLIALLSLCRIGVAQNCSVSCPPDYICISGICHFHPSSKKSSGPCTSGTDCASGTCVDHVCSLVPSKPHKTCWTDKDCLSGSCSAGSCIKTHRLGGGNLSSPKYCSQDSNCQSGKKCILNKCVQPKLADGSECTGWGECESGLCIMGKCQASSSKSK